LPGLGSEAREPNDKMMSSPNSPAVDFNDKDGYTVDKYIEIRQDIIKAPYKIISMI
jgi:hypothetical protein